MSRRLTAALVWAVCAASWAQPPHDGLAAARAALAAGEADRALELLNGSPDTAETHNLKCRVHFTLEHWDQAGSECEQAVRMDGTNSGYHMWLGRALGERADHASFVTAYSLGKRTREEFEAAVHADGHNAEALADLGEFYASAPGVVGGGFDKAENVATQLDRVDAARAAELRARVAEGRKDYGMAEQGFRQSVTASQHPAFQWMTLGSFLRRRQRWSEMETAVESGVKAAQRDRHAGVALYNGATVLFRANRNPQLAVRMLQDYLDGSWKTEEAPACAAHTYLARLKARMGDKAGAQQERAAALALAHDYKPALDLKF